MVEKFLLVGLKANLPETRDPNKLYFCSDTRELFKGNDLYTDAVRIVDALPADMAQGVLYILPSGEVKSFNGTDVITVAKPYVASTAGTLSAANTDDQVPTAKVVYDSIVEAVGAVVDGGELVNNVISTKAGTITVAKGAYTQLTGEAVFSEGTNYFTKVGESYVVDQTVTAENFAGKVEAGLFVSSDETDVALKGVVVNPSYDATTRTITLPYADGAESLVIGLGKDIFVDPTAENKYNAETGKIEIFLNDGNKETGATKLEIPASELVDIYTGAVSADGSATVAVSEDNTITASVNVSAEAGNGLSKKADGLFVDTTSAADFKAFKDSVDASLDDIDSQLNGEEIVLKEAGVAAEVEYVFDANDTVVVDGVETEVADQSALDTIVADENVSNVVVMVDGTEDRVAANAAAVAQAQAGVDANAEAIAANNEAIAALEAKNDVHVDATADNKFNAETGKVELYLNDSKNSDPIEIRFSKTDTFAVIYDITGGTQVYMRDVELSKSITISSELNSLIDNYYPGTELYTIDSDTGEYIKRKPEDFSGSLYDFAAQRGSVYLVSTLVTKVEVDMSGLTSQVAANTEAIASNKTEAKNYADGLNTAMDARVTVVEEKTQANEDAIAALEAKNDVHLDATAANKYNAETGKVELFLNDGDTIYHSVVLRPTDDGFLDFILLPEYGGEHKFYSSSHLPEDNTDSDILTMWVEDEYKPEIFKGIADFYGYESNEFDNENLYCTFYSENGEYKVVNNPLMIMDMLNGAGEAQLYVKATTITKVEVDMSGLTSQVAANTEAIASNKTEAKNYADGLNTAMDARVTVVEEKTQANEDAIAALEAKKDLRLDETADNKYNAETDKVELFLNDGGEVKESVAKVAPGTTDVPLVKIKNPSATYQASPQYYVYSDEQGNDISSEITADNFAEKVAEGLWVKSLYNASNANDVTVRYALENNDIPLDGLYYINSEGQTVAVTQHYELEGVYFLSTGYMVSQIEATKIEVDMTELASQVDANAEAITQAQAGVDANAEAITQAQAGVDANAEAIATLEAKNDVHVDATADNKFNAETGKVELFLNDSSVEYNPLTIWTNNNGYLFYFKVIDIPYSTISSRIASDNLFRLYDSSLNDITDQVSEDNFDEKVAEGLYYSDGLMTGGESMRSSLIAYNNPEKKYYYINTNGEYVQIDGSKLAVEYNSASPENRLCIGKTLCEQAEASSTKIEVDMTELTNIINSNNQSNTESIEALEEAVQWGTF